MRNGVWCKTYSAPPIDKREILLYAGYQGQADAQMDRLLDECLAEIQGVLSYRVCGRLFDVKQQSNGLYIGEIQVQSKALAAHVEGCSQAVIFAATVGIGVDRLLAKYADVYTAKAHLFQAIGAERIEALCDEVCKELEMLGETKTRFSPGYGDFSLETQKEFFIALDCERKIGLHLSDSFLMTPTKSVTAVVGIKV